MLKPIIVGLGNQLFGDDGIGVAVAAAARERTGVAELVDIMELGIRVIDLLPFLLQERRIVVVDAVACRASPGTAFVIRAEELMGVASDRHREAISTPQAAFHPSRRRSREFVSLHQHGLIETLASAQALGLKATVTVVGIVAKSWEEPSLSLSETLRPRIPIFVDLVLAEALK